MHVKGCVYVGGCVCAGFYIGIFCQGGEIRFYVFLNMYSLLCFPLVLLLNFRRTHFLFCKLSWLLFLRLYT